MGRVDGCRPRALLEVRGPFSAMCPPSYSCLETAQSSDLWRQPLSLTSQNNGPAARFINLGAWFNIACEPVLLAAELVVPIDSS